MAFPLSANACVRLTLSVWHESGAAEALVPATRLASIVLYALRTDTQGLLMARTTIVKRHAVLPDRLASVADIYCGWFVFKACRRSPCLAARWPVEMAVVLTMKPR
jgi:hypothetical protein